VAMWAFRYPEPMNNYHDNFVFVGVDFQPRPVYTRIQQWAAQ